MREVKYVGPSMCVCVCVLYVGNDGLGEKPRITRSDQHRISANIPKTERRAGRFITRAEIGIVQ